MNEVEVKTDFYRLILILDTDNDDSDDAVRMSNFVWLPTGWVSSNRIFRSGSDSRLFRRLSAIPVCKPLLRRCGGFLAPSAEVNQNEKQLSMRPDKSLHVTNLCVSLE